MSERVRASACVCVCVCVCVRLCVSLLFESCGSPNYMAPERLTREGYDEKSDIWNLGVLIDILIEGVRACVYVCVSLSMGERACRSIPTASQMRTPRTRSAGFASGLFAFFNLPRFSLPPHLLAFPYIRLKRTSPMHSLLGSGTAVLVLIILNINPPPPPSPPVRPQVSSRSVLNSLHARTHAHTHTGRDRHAHAHHVGRDPTKKPIFESFNPHIPLPRPVRTQVSFRSTERRMTPSSTLC